MTAEGQCTSTENKCLTNTFCPATDENVIQCAECRDSITSSQGCNCTANTPTSQCRSCEGTECSACIKGYALQTDKSCQKCGENCTVCTDSTTCTECAPKHFLLDKSCQSCSPGCTTCSDSLTCTICDTNLTLNEGKCLKKCINSACTAPEFCEISSNLCKGCESACEKCFNESICGVCKKDLQPTISGQCSPICKDLTDGHYCNGGTPAACIIGLQTACKCGMAENCASCSSDKTKCGTCLPGFKMASEECVQCVDEFTKFEKLCLLSAGKCNSEADKCAVNTFCDAADLGVVSCKKCDETIKEGKGCNCKNEKTTKNCQACESGDCSKCIQGYGLKPDGSCDKCTNNCSECTKIDICTICIPGFFLTDTKTCSACNLPNCTTCSNSTTCTACNKTSVLLNGKCALKCQKPEDCTNQAEFCDLTAQTCKTCTSGCKKCKNEEICGGCEDGKQLTISGACEGDCSKIAPSDGQYCKNGSPTNCSDGLTSQCKCGTADNCASCNTSQNSCDTCLQGFKKDDNGLCGECADNYEKYETLCLKVGDDKEENAKLSGGAIAGIVIGVLVVVGGVAGGLAFYFIKKAKANTADSNTKASMQ